MKTVIAVDAMGGDHGPAVTVPACLDFLASHPGSELLLVPGMGHDIPVALHETFADAIARVASRAEASMLA